MTQYQKDEIVKIAKQFVKGMGLPLNGSLFFIVDPLSGYLNAIGHENELKQIPATESHPMVLMMIFKDGDALVPAAADLKAIDPKAKNWHWLTIKQEAREARAKQKKD